MHDSDPERREADMYSAQGLRGIWREFSDAKLGEKFIQICGEGIFSMCWKKYQKYRCALGQVVSYSDVE